MKKGDDKAMNVSKVGPKGQIVIPKEIRDMFDIKPGDSLVLLADRKQGIAIQKLDFFSAVADSIFSKSSSKDEREFAKNIKTLGEESK